MIMSEGEYQAICDPEGPDVIEYKAVKERIGNLWKVVKGTNGYENDIYPYYCLHLTKEKAEAMANKLMRIKGLLQDMVD